jgi:hypothetical protein
MTVDGCCPCGATLTTPAEHAHGVCDGCRVLAKRRRRRPRARFTNWPFPELAALEGAPRRLVEIAGWPDYRTRREIERPPPDREAAPDSHHHQPAEGRNP